jgi:SAM-dependent methyltransferase
MVERISLEDKSLYRGYSNHIQRYNFAAPHCAGRRVLDAGCGTGYGSAFLALRGAASVTGVDISEEALSEAGRLYHYPNLRFLKGDVERLSEVPDLHGPFDVVVNLENIEHLAHPTRFLEGARRQLDGEGALVVSTPNGAITERDTAGNILNPFHVKEFSEGEFRELLSPHFSRLELYGQWRTPEWMSRVDYEERLFETICEIYYSPWQRLWRVGRRLLGRRCAPPPEFTGRGTSYPFDFAIEPITSVAFPWPPDVILAVCRP